MLDSSSIRTTDNSSSDAGARAANLFRRSKLTKAILLALTTPFFLAGCAQLPRPAGEPEVPLLSPIAFEPKSAIGAGTDRNSLEIETQLEDAFILRPMTEAEQDPLPVKYIDKLSFNDASVLDVLRLLIADLPISLSMSNPAHGNQSIYGSVVSYDLAGPLPKVLDSIARSAGFFYSYQDGVLRISPDEQFVVMLPPLVSEDLFAGMTNTVVKLGGFDTYLDRQGRSLVFRANRTAAKAIQGYMDHLREKRSMIVYDTYIYQVELADSKQTGIDWNNLQIKGILDGGPFSVTAKGLGGGAALTGAQGMGFNAVYDAKDLSVGALFTFLQSQGNVKTIAQPKLALLSGSEGSFKVGSEINYVAKVGTNTGNTLSQTTVETAKISAGLNLVIKGDNFDGTVDTRIEMSLTDILRLNSFQALGTELTLPQTTNRELKTAVRARAGDLVLLAGINNSRDSDDISGLPGTKNQISMVTKSGKEATRSELVIVLLPKVIRFKSKKLPVPAVPVAAAPPTVRGDASTSLAAKEAFELTLRSQREETLAKEVARKLEQEKAQQVAIEQAKEHKRLATIAAKEKEQQEKTQAQALRKQEADRIAAEKSAQAQAKAEREVATAKAKQDAEDIAKQAAIAAKRQREETLAKEVARKLEQEKAQQAATEQAKEHKRLATLAAKEKEQQEKAQAQALRKQEADRIAAEKAAQAQAKAEREVAAAKAKQDAEELAKQKVLSVNNPSVLSLSMQAPELPTRTPPPLTPVVAVPSLIATPVALVPAKKLMASSLGRPADSVKPSPTYAASSVTAQASLHDVLALICARHGLQLETQGMPGVVNVNDLSAKDLAQPASTLLAQVKAQLPSHVSLTQSGVVVYVRFGRVSAS